MEVIGGFLIAAFFLFLGWQVKKYKDKPAGSGSGGGSAAADRLRTK